MSTVTKTKTLGYSLLLLSGLLVLSVASLTVGPSKISLTDLTNPLYQTILWDLRGKRILLAIMVGGSLSVSGNIFQVILRNPLADPFILGISSAAAFGATIALFFQLNFAWMVGSALLMASILILIMIRASEKELRSSSHFLLLTGVLLSFLFSSLVTLCLSLAKPFEGAKLLFWLMGTLSYPLDWGIITLIGAGMILLWGIIYKQSYALNLMGLGEDEAHALGLPIQQQKRRLFLLASMTTALSVALCGTIGFVGLMIPHFVRHLFGNDHRLTIPLSILSGGIFLVAADTAIRLFSTQEIPIGVITALVGAPLFIGLLWRRSL